MDDHFANLLQRLNVSKKNISTFGKPIPPTLVKHKESLPIFKLKEDFLHIVEKNNVVVLIGETGSGKTTQIPQYLAEAKYIDSGKIGCTEPRRVAAQSAAKQVAAECGCKVGDEVGYAIRFCDCTSAMTSIKYLTDGMLLRECLNDRKLNKYSVIMLDEAHERSINTDILFGLLKETIQERRDLKLIVTSATLDSKKFSRYFFNAPVFVIPGKTFEVKIKYVGRLNEKTFLDECIEMVTTIHYETDHGDILVFLTGQEEIDVACEILDLRLSLRPSSFDNVLILPIYASMQREMQNLVFEPTPSGTRKIVVATNIAETSITIDGILYVVDSGFCKQKEMNPWTGIETLKITPISQGAAIQRAGRAGRTAPGICYRMYSEEDFKKMLPNTIPEIQRLNLDQVILLLKHLEIKDVLNFDFIDRPPEESLKKSLTNLTNLSALDSFGNITELGKNMAAFPLDPILSRILIMSRKLQCSEEILIILSMMSTSYKIFLRPKKKKALADRTMATFFHPEGDHLTLLNVYKKWAENNCSARWCAENFIHTKAMEEVRDIKEQLEAIMNKNGYPILSAGANHERIRMAIFAGYFTNIARRISKFGYQIVGNKETIFIHPSSAVFRSNPLCVIYHEVITTNKHYLKTVTKVEPSWALEFASTSFLESFLRGSGKLLDGLLY